MSSLSGQVYDTGKIVLNNGEFAVENCQVFGGFVVHIGRLTSGSVSVDDPAVTHVDYRRRILVAPNHSMTHVLNFALRKVLGDHIDQKGSLVDDAKLRFDFSHPRPLKPSEIVAVEKICNDQIDAGYEVFSMPVPLEKAREICSLRAVFGEVYPDPVRVVSIGHPVLPMLEDPQNEKWLNYSVEFCGGTHIGSTSEAQRFAITSEGGIATGVRRIVAVTMEAAQNGLELGRGFLKRLDALADEDALVIGSGVAAIRSEMSERTSELPSSSKAKAEKRMDELMKIFNKAKKKAAQESIKRASDELSDALEAANEQAKKSVVLKVSGVVDAKALRGALSTAMKKFPGVIVLFGVDVGGDKVLVFAGVAKSLVEQGMDASAFLADPLKVLGGRAGGKPELAQGKGNAVSKIDAALKAATDYVEKIIS
jgi:alanyl-tRNA synthetase